MRSRIYKWPIADYIWSNFNMIPLVAVIRSQIPQDCHFAITISITAYEGKNTSTPLGMIRDMLIIVLPRLIWYSGVERNWYDEFNCLPSGPMKEHKYTVRYDTWHVDNGVTKTYLVFRRRTELVWRVQLFTIRSYESNTKFVSFVFNMGM